MYFDASIVSVSGNQARLPEKAPKKPVPRCSGKTHQQVGSLPVKPV